MSQNVTISLDDIGIKPLLGHKGMISEVVLRPPTYDEYLGIGEIYSYAQSPTGVIIPIEDKEAVRAYMRLCLVAPTDPLVLEPGGMKLGRAMKGAVLSFFRSEPSKDAPSATSPTTSSGEPTSSVPTTSNE